jgi:predicted amidophosphoribosyltransferase
METRYFATGNYRKDGRSETAHAMKEGANWAIIRAAREMVQYIPTNAVLVPMPSHTGRATYTKDLCRLIARETAAEVCDYLRGKERETLYNLKKQGRHILPAKLGFYLSQPLPAGKRVIIIDNVVATGTTAAAAVRAIGGGVVFAYAAATNSQTRKDLIRLYPTI